MKIILDNVSKSIREAPILTDVRLELDSHQIYGLFGSNGSGKTMLMRVIAGLLKPSLGKVIIDGKELGSDTDFPDSMGFLIESPNFLASYTGFKNLQLIARLRGVDDEAITNAIKRVGLDPRDTRKYKKYSLGMKQRLGIAAAIMESPALLILDEPINALDEDAIELLADILREEKERGALVILACHDYDFLSSAADTIFYVKRGRVYREAANEE